MAKKETTVIYKSYFDMMELLLTNDSDWREAMTGLLKFGFEGEMPESDDPLIQAVYVAALPTMKTASERYEKAVENGKKGGRPTDIKDEDIIKLKEEGKTNKEIAELYNVTEKAIEKRVTKIGKTSPTNPTNLNVYENVYVNASVSENEANATDVANAPEREERIREKLENRSTHEDVVKATRLFIDYSDADLYELQEGLKDRSITYNQLKKMGLPNNNSIYDLVDTELHARAQEKADERLERAIRDSIAFNS